MDDANPLLPAAYDIAWSAASVVVLVLLIAALVSIARVAKRLTSGQALGWTLVVLLLPVVGAAAWFAIGRRAGMPAGAESAGLRPGRG
jgi:hypothetical protein